MALLVLLGLAVIGVGAALAATRAKTQLIGTGVVAIDTNLAYEGGQAAGTGMVLTSSGEVLTNNHVIAGATAITVSVPGTAHTYTARVVGYDVSDDIAVLQLAKASGLRTVKIASSTPNLGATVTAVGNAGGTGRLLSATGRVTGLGKTITASDGGSSEQLTGLIETDANVQPGDSGGPLLNASGRVVGMDTAGSTSGGPGGNRGRRRAHGDRRTRGLVGGGRAGGRSLEEARSEGGRHRLRAHRHGHARERARAVTESVRAARAACRWP
jgi:S1-C subfamily serine protease